MKDNRYVKEGEERILAIYFNTEGFAFTLMNNPLEVIEKGMVRVTPIDNNEIMTKLKRLVRKLKPERVVVEDYAGGGSHKSERIIQLLGRIVRYCKNKDIPYSRYSREQIRCVFEIWHANTKYEIAQVIARNVEAYANLLFEKPKYPKTEHSRSVQFDAASIGITHYYVNQ